MGQSGVAVWSEVEMTCAIGQNGEMSTPTEAEIASIAELAARARNSMNTVLDGKDRVVELSLITLLAGGHLLLEDVPGVGKTLLAKALGRVVDGSVRRIQFTPDLLPTDVVGVNLFNQETRHFEFRAGPVFSNVVIADEINRASPKTQSAMLECMAEGQASVDGTTYLMPQPFIVVATQNPIDMEGTYSLPEAQRDRFMIRTSVGYPSVESEAQMLAHNTGRDPLDELSPVTTLKEIERARVAVTNVTATAELRNYMVRLLTATRSHDAISVGVSPRGGVLLLRAAQAHAVLNGRNYVTPDDVQDLAQEVLAHRIIAVESDHPEHTSQLIRDVVAATPVS